MNQMILVPEWWAESDITALARASSFQEIVPIAIGVLMRMSEYNPHIVEICGPMSTGGLGSLEANMLHFRKAIRVAQCKGLHVFDQTPCQDAMVRFAVECDRRKEYCTDILDVFYRGLFKSGYIKELMFLPDWESSKGAKWERMEAGTLRIKISEYPVEWLPDVKSFKFFN